MGSFKLTKLERNWIFYDVGNSAFTLLITTIMPIYFNSLAENAGLSSVDYLAYWGYAASIVTLIVAVMGPTFGTLADTRGYKRPIFILFLVIGLVGCVALGFSNDWLIFLIVFVIAKTGYSASLIFYDSMLSDVTTHERMDMVSSSGYAWGYIGSCVPFILSLVLVLSGSAIGISVALGMQLAFCITAAWWLLFTLPLLKSYHQKHFVEKQRHAIRESFARLGRTFKNIKAEKKVFFFLLAFFFYIDGVYTIIAYFGIAVFAVFLTHQWQFWVLAVLVGMFQGGIQALSRSYFTRIIPPKQSGEYFGIMDICGKGASFMGTTLVSAVSQITGDINTGVGMIALLFIVGMVFFQITVRIRD